MASRPTKKQALRAVRARLPISGDKPLQISLEYAVDSLAEAYRLGAEEAQHIIAVRIDQAYDRAAAPKSSKPNEEARMARPG